ncbi:MAG: DEAD/DEAH box helicase family protein, partial [Methanomicrobiales archaeon]|nr:DEAD/DEAH box helicase family protein [Methanomicrobiales archaeon]
MTAFRLTAPFKPAGDQPKAIAELIEGFQSGEHSQTLLGVTGSGKTYTMANVIEAIKKPTLVVAHNKTLAAQLYNEFREFFPENHVEYFVSYYDYYQPESYIPEKDQYIEKDAQINPKIEQHRMATTASLMGREDVIVVASVSCIYGLGNPANYRDLGFELRVHARFPRREILQRLVEIQYERNELDLGPGKFRVKGDVIDLVPAYSDRIIRVELWGDEIERIREMEPHSGQVTDEFKYFHVYPARHFVIPDDARKRAIETIKAELDEWLPNLGPLEAYRLKTRTLFDLDMIEETGYCKGIENYSRHFDFRAPGQKPYCLLDYFPQDFLLFIDESHQTIPQLHGMYNGDRSRKKALVDYGFRLPSAYDNRPLRFQEFEGYMRNVVFVSATPVIRECEKTIARGDRCLVMTLTKRLAEELADYLSERGIKSRYLHSEIETIERTEIIRQLRLGKFDVLVGINLLREGLDIPEVGFIGILDADKEGFLRDERSLIQIIG